jgi:predicted ATPase
MRVGAYGGQRRRTYGVLGDATNLSARLMQAAKPGQILVSDEAYARAGSSFTWESLPAIRVKGKRDPISINMLVGVKKRQSGLSLTSLFPKSPVGRQVILAGLEQALSGLLAGHGQVVRLVGEPGMGKSHLAAEFSRQAAAQQVHLALGVCQSISRGAAYTPWRQVFYSLLDLGDCSEEEAVDKLTTLVKSEHPEWELRLPLLGDLLALPIPDNLTTAAMESDLRQKSLFSLLVEMVQFWAGQQPLAILIENAQWMDEASLALAQVIAQQAAGTTPVLLLLIHRPAQLGEEQVLPKLNGLTNYIELVLAEMPADEMFFLVQDRLGGPASLLLQMLVQRLSQGNPFFLIELLETMRQGNMLSVSEFGLDISPELLLVLQTANLLVQAGGEWQLKPDVDLSAVKLNVPDSIQGLVLSRLDRLPEEHKLTLKVSSVIGYTIDLMLVTMAHPEHKDLTHIEAEARDIENQEIIHKETPGDLLYAFRHHSSQEVIYETLLYQQRQQVHKALALALVERFPDAVTQIAHHAFMGQVWPLALQYNFKAGEAARHLHANQQSMDFYNKALRCTEELPEGETANLRKMIHLALGELLVSAGDHESALAHLDKALALAVQSGDIETQASVYRWYGRSFELRGNFSEALEWLDKGFEVLQNRVSSEEAELSLIAGLINHRQGQSERTLELCERSLTVAKKLDQAALEARTYNLMGIVDLRAHPDRAIEKFQLSLAQYERLGNVYGQATSHNLIANGYFAQSEWDQAEEHYRSSLDMFTQLGNLYNQVLVSNNLGGIALKQGRFEAALGYYQRAIRLLQQTGGSLWVFGALHLNIGHVYIHLRQLDEAFRNLETANGYLDRAGVRDLLPELFGLFAEAAWLQGNLDKAAAYATNSLELARELNVPREYGHNLRIMGEIARAQGNLAEAGEFFKKSYDTLVEVGDEYESAKTQLAWAKLLAAEEQWKSAYQACKSSEEVFARLANHSDLTSARQLRLILEEKQA